MQDVCGLVRTIGSIIKQLKEAGLYNSDKSLSSEDS